MNTIPTVGPDTAIAPRTGSGSPQTPTQQRTDAAPSVLSDAPATVADPGVMLKITPPVQARQGDPKVSEQVQNSALDDWSSLINDPDIQRVVALTGSATEADEAVQARVSQAFEALPLDVQEAIRLASTPAIAKLLRLAALTAPGIKEAPAVLQNSMAPVGYDVSAAVQGLRQILKQAPPFMLAQLLQEFAGVRTPDLMLASNAEQALTSKLGQTVLAQMPPANVPQQVPATGTFPAQALYEPPTGAGAQALAQTYGPAQVNLLEDPQLAQAVQASHELAEDGVPRSPAGVSQPLAFQGSVAQVIPDLGTIETSQPHSRSDPAAVEPSPDNTGEAPPAVSAQRPFLQGSYSFAQEPQLAQTPLQTMAPTQPALIGIPAERGAIAQENVEAINAGISNFGVGAAQHTEAAIRDGLRLLMDGRMLWQGLFTPGVPMQFERSDAWQTNRRSLGGMEKGTSIKVKLQLPHIGALEVRAMGFGGQVSVRLHADPSVAPVVAGALPELQTRLKNRGLAGAQVLVDSL